MSRRAKTRSFIYSGHILTKKSNKWMRKSQYHYWSKTRFARSSCWIISTRIITLLKKALVQTVLSQITISQIATLWDSQTHRTVAHSNRRVSARSWSQRTPNHTLSPHKRPVRLVIVARIRRWPAQPILKLTGRVDSREIKSLIWILKKLVHLLMKIFRSWKLTTESKKLNLSNCSKRSCITH
jgi:hypothetical protein